MSQSHADKFTQALKTRAPLYKLHLEAGTISRLRDYYELVRAWNPRLHLVAPCQPAGFATRHVLESLTLLPYLSRAARVADVGSGAGLPLIPCLIVRPDIEATLIEASQKKSIFLREAVRLINSSGRAKIIADRFENLPSPEAEFVTCRALERFTEMFPKLLSWSAPHAQMLLFFGGDALRKEIERAALRYEELRMPESERRFLFIIQK
jgi:16S rRNA (guanine527-N7)-methyltransferase